MRTRKPKPLMVKMPDCPVVFCLPSPKLTLSAYAEVTGQTLRTVQQAANENRLTISKKKRGKEREVNMVYEFLVAYEEAQEALRMKV
ncbi:hypothetical protein H3H12_02740 [Serratia marcescens]|uniref:hypothetical protein n=1 Tax=Serratia TaxID=613 RepID=UPI000A5EED8A|nr:MULTISPECIES: hypothetical protein [Serratia]MBH2895387.1 hypothetical protein [Serratia ureilytica]MBN3901723.1 hypothetical protein [Serratia marcescens]MBN3914352.1 hypothetical protein [Serratia marcescens]MBN3917947.1 hypothetical protein [Serratia marcescens]MBN3933865.1 hypothetical protein [Serratia marcescens]